MQRLRSAPIRALLLSLFTIFALASVASPALAEDKKIEAAAKDALKKVEDDFLQGDYAKAIDKLKKALDGCGADKCTKETKAQLHRDLGAMYFYAKKKDDALASFVEALKLVPDAGLNINYKTPDVDAVYEEAKKKAAGAAKPPDGPGPDGPPAGDFKHEPAAEQAVRTPLPIYVTYSGSSTIAKVVAKYKGFGETEFKQVELTKMGDGWGGLVPCKDVTQGTMQYYIQGFDASNDPVATSGDRNRTFKVAIKDKIDGDPPSLPGASPPKQCQDTGDCPPDFPGCHKGGGGGGPDTSHLKDEGEECEEDSACKSGTCKANKCTAESGKKAGKNARVWVGLAAGFDFLMVPSGDDVCLLDKKTALPINTAGYYCTNSDGTDYPFRNDKGVQNGNIVQGKSDQVKGGLNPSNIRLMLTIDYAVNANFLIGARLGYVLGGYSGSAAQNDGKTFFAPVHLEVRGTYVVGKDALWKPGFAPMVFFGAGASQFDSKVDVTVVENGSNGPKSVSAWAIGGPLFIDVGGGGRYAMSAKAALYGAAKFTAVLGGGPGFMPAVGPEVGVQFGF